MGGCASILSQNVVAASAGPAQGEPGGTAPLLPSALAGQATSEAMADPTNPEEKPAARALGQDSPSPSAGPGSLGQSMLPPITMPPSGSSLPPIMARTPVGRMLDDVPLPNSGFSNGSSEEGPGHVPPHRHFHHHILQDPAPWPPEELDAASPPDSPPMTPSRGLPDMMKCTSPPVQRWGPGAALAGPQPPPADESVEWDYSYGPGGASMAPADGHQQLAAGGDAGYPLEGPPDELGDSYGGPTSLGVLKDIIGLSNEEQQQGGMPGYGGGYATGAGGPEEQQHQPEADEIIQYARHLGMDLSKDADLLWIAEQALRAPLPAHWSCHYDEGSGNDYYYNEISGVTAWEHPLHEHFRALFLQMSEEKERSAIKSKLAGLRNKEQARDEVRRAATAHGGARRREQPRESFISDLDDSHRFDDSNFTGTDMDSSLDTTMDFSRHRLSDTYNSLDMSLSNSEIGGLKLNLMGIIQNPKKTRGTGLGLDLKQHGKEDGRGSRQKQGKKLSGKAAFARMLSK